VSGIGGRLRIQQQGPEPLLFPEVPAAESPDYL